MSLKPGFDRRLGLWLGAAAVLATAVLSYGEVLSFWFVGVDVFPLILSNRLDSPLQISELLTREYLAAYTGQQIAGSVGVRPTGALLFAVDYSLWRLTSLGYHLTDLIIHVCNSLLVLLLARELAPKRWLIVGVAAAVVFARHPLASSAVPLISGRYDLLLCTFSLLFLATFLRYLRTASIQALLAALAFALLALASKETAIVLLPMAAIPLGLRAYDRGQRLRLWDPVLLSLGAVFVAYLLYRQLVVGHLGGYPLAGREALAIPLLLRRFFDPLLYLPTLLPEGRIGQLAAYAVVLGTTALLAVFACVGAVHYLLRVRLAPFAKVEAALGPDARSLFVLSSWLLGYLALYGAAYMLTGIFKPLYLYVTSAVWCLLIATLTVGLVQRLRAARPLPSARPSGVAAAAVGLAAATFFIGSLVAPHSQRQLDRWARASDVGRSFVEDFDSAVAGLPSGSTIYLVNLPHVMDCSRPPCIGWTYMFEDYTLDARQRLTAPTHQLQLIAVSTVWIPDEERPIRSSADYDPRASELTVTTWGGRVEPPWYSQAAAHFAEIELTPSGRDFKLRLLLADQRSYRDAYVFDFFGERSLIPLASEEQVGLVTGPGATAGPLVPPRPDSHSAGWAGLPSFDHSSADVVHR